MGVKVDYANKINAQDLDTIYITGGGFIRRAFKGVSRDSAWGWAEPVWGGDLTRSTDFILTNILDVNFGLVPRCEISYKYMNVQDYIDLMKISKERVVKVDFFNRESGQRETREMAFTGNELGKLYAFGTDYLGVQDVKIKLVATNRENAKLINTKKNVTFNMNGGVFTDGKTGETSNQKIKNVLWSDNIELLGASNSYTEKSGEDKITYTDTITKDGYNLAYWATKDPQGNYDRYFEPYQSVTIWENMDLYAIWEAK